MFPPRRASHDADVIGPVRSLFAARLSCGRPLRRPHRHDLGNASLKLDSDPLGSQFLNDPAEASDRAVPLLGLTSAMRRLRPRFC